MSRLLSADRIVGVILLILCCLFTYFAFDLAKTIPPFFQNQPMRVDTLPRILGIAGIIASVVTIIAPTTGSSAAQSTDADKQLKENQDRMADLSFDNFGQDHLLLLGLLLAVLHQLRVLLLVLLNSSAVLQLLLIKISLLRKNQWLALKQR